MLIRSSNFTNYDSATKNVRIPNLIAPVAQKIVTPLMNSNNFSATGGRTSPICG